MESSSLSFEENDYHDLELIATQPPPPSVPETDVTAPPGCIVDTGIATDSPIRSEEDGHVDEALPVQPEGHVFSESENNTTSDKTTQNTLSITNVSIILSIWMSVLYFTDFNVLSVAVAAALLALLYRCMRGPTSKGVNVLAELDYPALICYLGEFILVGSLNDTGLPQKCAEHSFGRMCRTFIWNVLWEC